MLGAVTREINDEFGDLLGVGKTAFDGLSTRSDNEGIRRLCHVVANALLVGAGLVYPGSFPRTLDRLVTHGLDVVTDDLSGVQKAEGASPVEACSSRRNRHVSTIDRPDRYVKAAGSLI